MWAIPAFSIAVVLNFYTLKQTLISWMAISLTNILFCEILTNGLMAIVLLTVSAYDLHLRINQINNKFDKITKNSDLRTIFKTIDKYMTEHNRLSKRVNILSNYWKSFNLVMILTIFPITLILVHQALFEDGDIFLKFMYILGTLESYFVLFLVQYFLASLSSKMHKMCKKLSHFQWLLKGRVFSYGFKLRLLMCFERLSHKKKRVGFSIGSLAIITFPLFFGVSPLIQIEIQQNSNDMLIYFRW